MNISPTPQSTLLDHQRPGGVTLTAPVGDEPSTRPDAALSPTSLIPANARIASPYRPAPSLPQNTDEPEAFHRIARTIPHRSFWWRPLVTAAVSAATFVVLVLQLSLVSFALSFLFPSFAPSASFADPLNPFDGFFGFGHLALLIPAVLIGTLAGYGRIGIAHSVFGRFRWGLIGRAALVIVPAHVLINSLLSLVMERDAIVVPALTGPVLLAWIIAIVLSPLQSAGEEYAFRALPMQIFGTWLRWPIVGILLPVPLFVLGHGYEGLGKVHVALFAILMGLLAWKTGGLELPILMHAANNWTLFAIAPLIPGFTEQGEVDVVGFLLATGPMVLMVCGLWWWYSRSAGLRIWEPQRGRAASPSLRIPRSRATSMR